MLKSILRSIFQGNDGAFESYYQRVLETAASEVAPSASEAKADYLRAMRRRDFSL
ncbi:MAG: hypothetical protein ACYC3S_07295 [Chloroflexota bacterium]